MFHLSSYLPLSCLISWEGAIGGQLHHFYTVQCKGPRELVHLVSLCFCSCYSVQMSKVKEVTSHLRLKMSQQQYNWQSDLLSASGWKAQNQWSIGYLFLFS